MRRLLYLLCFIFSCCLFAVGQSTTISITATDPSGQVWANGSIRYFFQRAPGKAETPNWQGNPLSNIYYSPQTVALDNNGTGSFTVPSNTAITPAGSTWIISVCPNATAGCATISVGVTGPTTDLSSAITAAMNSALVIPIQAVPKAYSDNEIQTTANQGGLYYNTGTINPGFRYWNGISFQALAGGGGGTVSLFTAKTANWPTWLVPSVSNPNSTPDLQVQANAIPNSALQNNSMTINSANCVLGGSCTITGSAVPSGPNFSMQSNSSSGGSLYGDSALVRDASGNLTSTGHISANYFYANGNNSNCYAATSSFWTCQLESHTYDTRLVGDGDETDAGIYRQVNLYGAGSAVVNGGHNWTVGKGLFMDFNDNVRGIGQAINLNTTSHSISDKAGIYTYFHNDPGCGLVSQDEGCTGMTIQMLQNNLNHTGTITGGSQTQPTLSIQGPFTDGGYLMDVSTSVASAFAGNASADGSVKNWVIPVTAGSMPLSNAICVSSNPLPDPGVKRNAQGSATVTVTCQAITGKGTPSLTTGIAELGGPYGSYGPPESVNITAVSGSSVTLSYSLPHSTGFAIFQGGVAGDAISVDSDYSYFGYRTTYVALGARNANELIYCAVEFSDCNLPLPRTGETTETSSSAIHLYPAAEIVANLNGGGIQVEPNSWVAGASTHAIETNPPSFSTGTAEWLIDNTDFMCSSYLGGCNGFYLEYQGKHVSGAYQGFVIENHNPCSMYTACDSVNGKLSEPLAAMIVRGNHQWNHYESNPQLGVEFVNDAIGTNTDYSYGLIQTNSGGNLLDTENNQTNAISSTGVPPNTASLRVKSADFIAPCVHFDVNSNNIGDVTCPLTVHSKDGAGSTDITLNNPDVGSTKNGLIDNTTGGSIFNGPVKVAATPSQPCLATDSAGKLVGCSSNNIQITAAATVINANSCSAVSTVAMTNVTTSSTFAFTPTGNIGSVTGWGGNGGLKLFSYPTAGNLNWYVCNQTASAITPSATVTFNVSAH